MTGYWILGYLVLGVLFAEACRKWSDEPLATGPYLSVFLLWLPYLIAIATGFMKRS